MSKTELFYVSCTVICLLLLIAKAAIPLLESIPFGGIAILGVIFFVLTMTCLTNLSDWTGPK